MSALKKPAQKFPSSDTVRWDYGYKMSVLQRLVRPNKFICGYCLQQAVTEGQVRHQDGCPEGGAR